MADVKGGLGEIIFMLVRGRISVLVSHNKYKARMLHITNEFSVAEKKFLFKEIMATTGLLDKHIGLLCMVFRDSTSSLCHGSAV